MTKLKRKYAITGLVQGVWYRKCTADAAVEIGVDGYVRNLPNGSVEVLASGTEQQIAALESALWKGSPASKVEDIQIESTEDAVDSGFEVIWGDDVPV